MRKIYSLVLMTAMLFVGTNVWADDISVVNHTKGKSLSTNDLQAAIDSVGAGDSATITLNNTITISKAIVIPHVTGTINETTNPTVYARDGQRICLDMNGFNIQGDDDATGGGYGCIQILKGTLNIKSSAGPSIIKRPAKTGAANDDKSVLTVYGAPSWHKDGVWTVVEIGENISLDSREVNKSDGTPEKVYGLCIQELDGTARPYCYGDTSKIGYQTYYNGQNAAFFANHPEISCKIQKIENGVPQDKYNAGCAYGVKVFIRGKIYGHMRGINVVGNINATPQCDISDTIKHRHSKTYPYYEHNYPYVKIYPTATIWCVNQGVANDNNGGIYAGGYCVWDISGNVHGQTGIYAKAGDFVLTDATVASDCPTYGNSGDYHSGTTSGSGIFIASDAGYAGGTGVTLEGDTKITGNGGAAITDVLATNSTETGSTTSHLTINGGTIEQGEQGAINITAGTAAQTTVSGGNITGTYTYTDDQGQSQQGTISSLTPTGTHTTTVVVDGKETIVVSEGTIVSTDEKETVNGGSGNVIWKHNDATTTDMTDAIATPTTLDYLEINQSYKQTLTINANQTLTVGRVILGEHAEIIVQPGAKFIVTGSQGIVAPKTTNIKLCSSETAQAIFLFNPDVTSNRHPNATVELISDSYRTNATDRRNHRFGIPMYNDGTATYNGVKTISASPANATVFFTFDYANDSWINIGYINDPTYGNTLDLTRMDKPFEFYQLLCNVAKGTKTTFTFTGALVGNNNPSKTIPADVWYGISNSFMGDMDLAAIINGLGGNISKSVWVYDVNGPKAYAWRPANLATAAFGDAPAIKPMQAMLVRNMSTEESAVATINYKTTVWDPATGGSSAPARTLSAASWTTAMLVVSDENGYGDQVRLVQSNDFTTAYDNGYDAEKYFNGDINFYVSDSRAMSILATDDLADTYLGFSCVNGGIYTIDFSHIQGNLFDLIDLEANQTIHMTEGASYQFAAYDNEQNDYRFRIVPRQEMPTDIETVENGMIKTDGVYTITGQYLGDLNIWNTLPAGLYIVNGEKKVK